MIVEAKADKDMTSEVVQGKQEAAERWANHVNADERVAGEQWQYVLDHTATLRRRKDRGRR